MQQNTSLKLSFWSSTGPRSETNIFQPLNTELLLNQVMPAFLRKIADSLFVITIHNQLILAIIVIATGLWTLTLEMAVLFSRGVRDFHSPDRPNRPWCPPVFYGA
jgi:hypothetical protein